MMTYADTERFDNDGRCRYPDDLDTLENLHNWRLVAGETDPRGYDLIGSDGEKIGTIKNLLASPSTQKAYFAIVDTGNWFQHHLYAVPLVALQFDPDDKTATGAFTRAEFHQAPEYHAGDRNFDPCASYWQGFAAPVSTAGTIGAMGATGAAATTAATDTLADRARIPASAPASASTRDIAAGNAEVRVPVTEETAEIHKEQHEVGAVVLHKEVETETKHISEPVTHTRVVAETREVPADAAGAIAPGATTLREGETLRIPVVEEELVVEKRPRVVEEVVIRTRPETEQVEQDVQLRHERVEVDEEGEVDVAETPGKR